MRTSIGRGQPGHIVKADGYLGAGFGRPGFARPGSAGPGNGPVLMMWRAWRGGQAELMPRTSAGLAVGQENWRAPAACQSADPDLFFPISSSGPALAQVAQAKAICAGCQVRPECLAFAVRTHQVHGVWGGLSEQER